jgi:hypothetical protein
MEIIEALRLNKKGNKGKEKVVEEKEESGMETVLNTFEKGDRGERDRGGRGERGERGREARTDSTQTPNTTQSKPQSLPTITQHNSINLLLPQQTKPNKMKC